MSDDIGELLAEAQKHLDAANALAVESILDPQIPIRLLGAIASSTVAAARLQFELAEASRVAATSAAQLAALADVPCPDCGGSPTDHEPTCPAVTG